MKASGYLQNIAKFSGSLEEELKNHFVLTEYSKGEFLFKEGEFCHHLYYIEKGLVRVYYHSGDGKEITVWFSAENSFITAIDSFYYNKPTRDFCEVIEDSIVYAIGYSELEAKLINEKGARLAFHILFEVTRKMTEFIDSIKFQSAEERYKLLISKFPSLQQRVSLGHIASYLGITQETLSRIRAKK